MNHAIFKTWGSLKGSILGILSSLNPNQINSEQSELEGIIFRGRNVMKTEIELYLGGNM
jgi:hypothetical protein